MRSILLSLQYGMKVRLIKYEHWQRLEERELFMSLVILASGGLDSTLVSLLAQEEGASIFPLFIDYGQKAADREWMACKLTHKNLGLPHPQKMDLSGFGQVILTGLTSPEKDVKTEAFTPGRNLLFLLAGTSYAYQRGADAVAIGLLAEKFSLFPDQKEAFLEKAEKALEAAVGKSIRILAPLFDFNKADVCKLAQAKGIKGTYSCHNGGENPCGACIACLEFSNIQS